MYMYMTQFIFWHHVHFMLLQSSTEDTFPCHQCPFSSFHIQSSFPVADFKLLAKSTLESACRYVTKDVTSTTSYLGVVDHCLRTLAWWTMQTIGFRSIRQSNCDVTRIKHANIGVGVSKQTTQWSEKKVNSWYITWFTYRTFHRSQNNELVMIWLKYVLKFWYDWFYSNLKLTENTK